MRDAFASNDFTDMTIVCDKREFHCHKFLLAAISPYFRTMFFGPIDAGDQGGDGGQTGL